MSMKKKWDSIPTMQTDRHGKLNQVLGLGLVLDVRSKNEKYFFSAVTTGSWLFFIREGALQVEADGSTVVARQGDFLLLQSGVPIKVTHIPAASGVHETSGLFWDRTMLSEASPTPENYLQTPFLFLGERGEDFQNSFMSACRSLRQAENLPPSIIAYRLREVLLWLSLESIYFRPAENHTFTSRLRDLLVATPGDAWSGKKTAKALGQSQSTLRRHLAAEATSFREILTETRMLHAMRLLHSTDESIGNIARASGYACQSRFALRFRERFGFHPSIVRGHNRGKSTT